MLAKLASSTVSLLADPLAYALTLANADASVMMFFVLNSVQLASNIVHCDQPQAFQQTEWFATLAVSEVSWLANVFIIQKGDKVLSRTVR